jgi:acyl-coenzyme A synthetase/AMP-(fatty) acid ligase
VNLGAVVAAHADSQPDKPAVDSGDEVLTYRQLNERASRIVSRLRSAGARAGDLVATQMIDSPTIVAALVAIARIGAIVIPIDWRSSVLEVRRLIERFGAPWLFTDNERPVPEGLPCVGLEDIESEPVSRESPVDLSDAPLVYALTSGTTGLSKGIVVTHEEMYERAVVFLREGMIAPDDRFLAAMPLAYAAGREFHWSLLICGATIVKTPSLFSAADLIAITQEKRISALLVAPNVSRQLLALPRGAADHLFPKLRVYVSSTGKLTAEERAVIRARVSPNLIDFYGSTGSGPIAAISGPQDEPSPTSAGHVTSGLEVEIVDDGRQPLPDGQVGMIRLRGPRITKRFAGDIDSESEGIHNGWYYPGDLASIDENGLLHLHGRSADLIKRGGLMVHAQEVERILMLHDSVVEAAVVGFALADLGEEVAAFIVPRGPIHLRELTLHCIKHLAPFKVPTRIETIDSLPRNANGKVQKTILRDLLQKTYAETGSQG